MRSFLKRLIGEKTLIAAVPVALLAGAWLIGQSAIDHLLYRDAVITGKGWTAYLADNVKDLPRIVVGEQPTPESRRLFERAQKVGQIFRYVLYDPQGQVRLASDGGAGDDTMDAEARNPSAIRAIATGGPVVHAEETDEEEQKARPPLYAEIYLPIFVGGREVGVVETDVNQTERRGAYRHALIPAGVALVVLVGVAFGVLAAVCRRRDQEKRMADAHIDFLVHHDALTGLLNRTTITDSASKLMQDGCAEKHGLALHYVDIDHFKDINDMLGHGSGDVLIQAVAARLRARAGSRDSVARIGGDEFVVLQAESDGAEHASAFAKRIVTDLARPFVVKGHVIGVTASVGTALAPGHGESVRALMRSADLALYRAKAAGRNGCTLFSSEIERDLADRLHLERTIRHAVDHSGFALLFQPAVAMPERRLVGFEALVRMRDDSNRLVSPALFIPLAEKMGLIDEIGTWVLREACRIAATWPADLKVAVNLSPAQFSTGKLVNTVATALAESGLSPRQLEMEVTEGMLLESSANVLAQLAQIKAFGVGIVMDDFGTGYSSLSYLWKFPFDKIKIDRSFMLGLDQASNQASTIVRTIIDLGRSINVTVTVEGVENENQLDFVTKARCDQIQGYYFGRPVPAEQAARRILQHLLGVTVPRAPSAVVA